MTVYFFILKITVYLYYIYIYIYMRNDMFITILQQILSGILLLVVIIRLKK